MEHPEKAAGKLVVAGCDGAIDFAPTEGALNAVGKNHTGSLFPAQTFQTKVRR